VSELRARTGLRTLVGLLAAMGLLLALTLPALAHHDPPNGPEVTPTQEDFPGGDPICPAGSVGGRINDPDTGDEATVQLPDQTSATFKVLSISDDELTFEVVNGLAARVFVKGGTDGQNVYDYSGMPGGGIAHDDGLITPTSQGVSHLDFCLVAAPESTPTPTPTPSPTPRESELGGNPTPSPTPRESELGGNPTPTPGAEVPDTATTGLVDQVPALVLSLVLVGSLATLFYVRVAGQRQ
jgi:hypothetical protein